MRVTFHRKAHFNAAHRLFIEAWDEEKNAAVFGKCSNPHYHGHNYELVVSVTGEVDPETGFVVDMKVLKELIYKEIETSLDHKNLNVEVPEFRTVNPTAENISVYIWNKLKPHLKQELELSVTLYETPRNYVTYNGNE